MMRTLILVLLALLVLMVAFFSYQHSQANIISEDQNAITYQTGYGISGVGSTTIYKEDDYISKNCIKVWSAKLKKYMWKCR